VAPYHRYVEVFSGLFEKGIREGSIRTGVEPRSAAQAVIAVRWARSCRPSLTARRRLAQVTRKRENLVDGLVRRDSEPGHRRGRSPWERAGARAERGEPVRVLVLPG
jgi:hypothetical protein